MAPCNVEKNPEWLEVKVGRVHLFLPFNIALTIFLGSTMITSTGKNVMLKECINEVWDDVKDGGAHWWMEFQPYLIVPKTLGATFYAYSEGERWRITAKTCGELRCEALDYSWTNVTGLKKVESTWDEVKYLTSSKL